MPDGTDNIRGKLVELSKEFMPDSSIVDDTERLIVIGSESVRAIEFLMAIEDEFEIEIEDDALTPDFFSDYTFICKAVEEALEVSPE